MNLLPWTRPKPLADQSQAPQPFSEATAMVAAKAYRPKPLASPKPPMARERQSCPGCLVRSLPINGGGIVAIANRKSQGKADLSALSFFILGIVAAMLSGLSVSKEAALVADQAESVEGRDEEFLARQLRDSATRAYVDRAMTATLRSAERLGLAGLVCFGIGAIIPVVARLC